MTYAFSQFPRPRAAHAPAAEILDGPAVERAAPDWQDLVARRPEATLFSGPFLQLTNRAVYGPEDPFRAIALEGGSGLAAILPLSLWRMRIAPGLVVRELGFFRSAHTLRNDLLLPLGAEDSAAEALLATACDMGGWDTLHLENVPGGTGAFWTAAMDQGLLIDPPRPGRQLMHADLAGGYDVFLATRSGQFRRQLRKRRRELETAGRLTIRRISGAAAIRAMLPAWMGLVDDSWQGHTADPRDRAFHAAVAGCGQLWWLTLDDRPLAALRMLEEPGRLHVHTMHYDPAAGARAPGLVLFDAMMADAAACGIRQVDFNGSSPFFARWATGVTALASVRIYAPTARGRLVWAARRGIVAFRGSETRRPVVGEPA